jgi:hypothetical protein
LVSTNIVVFVRVDALASLVDTPLKRVGFGGGHKSGRFGKSSLAFGMLRLAETVNQIGYLLKLRRRQLLEFLYNRFDLTHIDILPLRPEAIKRDDRLPFGV